MAEARELGDCSLRGTPLAGVAMPRRGSAGGCGPGCADGGSAALTGTNRPRTNVDRPRTNVDGRGAAEHGRAGRRGLCRRGGGDTAGRGRFPAGWGQRAHRCTECERRRRRGRSGLSRRGCNAGLRCGWRLHLARVGGAVEEFARPLPGGAEGGMDAVSAECRRPEFAGGWDDGCAAADGARRRDAGGSAMGADERWARPAAIAGKRSDGRAADRCSFNCRCRFACCCSGLRREQSFCAGRGVAGGTV